MVDGVKFERKEVVPCENSRAVHISPHNSGTVIDSEKSSINAYRKSTMGFPTSHQPRSCVTPNFLAVVVLVSAAYENSPAGCWVYCNIVILTYVLTDTTRQ